MVVFLSIIEKRHTCNPSKRSYIKSNMSYSVLVSDLLGSIVMTGGQLTRETGHSPRDVSDSLNWFG